MSENEKYIEKIANGIINYLEFENNLKINELNKNTENKEDDIKYKIQQFNYECYIIDKKHFEDFCLSVKFDKLKHIVNPIINENKIKFKEELRKYLDKSPQMQNWDNIKIYSEEDELKNVVKNIKYYSFINKELLCDGMCIPIENLEGKEIKISKNKNKYSLLSVKNNFILTFNENNIKEYKNLYYVEEITKKIFVLLYYNEKKIQEKIKNEIKDVYNFERYYLINKDWLDEYKEFFSYDNVIKKIKNNLKDYSYQKIKIELNDIVKRKIGQIKLYGETKVPNTIRNASKLVSESKRIKLIKDNNENKSTEYYGPSEEEQENLPFFIPNEFELINEDIFELLMKEEFFYNMNDKIKKILSYEVLFGNNQIIIKNKLNEKYPDLYEYLYNYLIFVKNDEINGDNNKYIFKYILNYENKYIFFKDFYKIIKEGLKKYMDSNEIKLNKKTNEQNIFDEKKNILGKFIDIKINPNDFKTIFVNNNKNSLNDENVKKSKKNQNNKNSIISINEIKFSYIIKNNNNDKTCNEKIREKENKIIQKIEEISIIHDKSDNNGNNISLNYNESNLNKEEDNFKNDTINESVECNFKTLRRKINIIEPFLNELFKEITKDKKSIINILIPQEIIEKKDTLKQIILMEENSFQKFKSILNYDLINQYLNSNEKEKKELLEQKMDIFSDLYKIIENPDYDISTKFPIIKDYNKSILNNKYFILYKNKFQYLYQQSEKISIFYYINNNNEYIFFENKQKILRLNKMKDKYLYIVENFEYDQLNILKQFKLQIDSNKDIKNLDLNKSGQKCNIKEYYLIDNKWVDIKIFNYEMEKMQKTKNINTNIKPTSKTVLKKYNYPTNFIFLEKNKYENIICEFAKKTDININNFIVYKIFFVHWQNNIPKKKQIDKVYLGILDKNYRIIYFYLIDKDDYTFDFLIDLDINVKNIDDILNNIKQKGIGQFLYEMGIDQNFGKIEEKKDLIDFDLKKIGTFINFNINPKKDICSREYAKSIQNSNYFCGILQCLANLKEFKDFFLNKKEIIKFNEKDNIFTKYFYKTIQDLWFGFNDNVNNNLNINFMEEIKKEDSNDIFNSIKLLIDSLLLKIHNEIKTGKNNKRIKNITTKLNEMYEKELEINNFYGNNVSFIQNLFFFDMELKSFCSYCKKNYLHYYINYCSLDLEIKQTLKNNNIKIQNILSYNLIEDLNCECSKIIKCKKQFRTLPKYLIIIIKQPKDQDYKFKMGELIDLDINNYLIDNSNFKNKSKYELVSIMDNNLVIYCKSPINNKWYKYIEKDIKNIEKINTLMIAANLLIYRQIKI